jgi:hypothetical protein
MRRHQPEGDTPLLALKTEETMWQGKLALSMAPGGKLARKPRSQPYSSKDLSHELSVEWMLSCR